MLTELSFYKRIHSQIVWASKFGAQMVGDVPFIDEKCKALAACGPWTFADNKGEYRGEQLYNLQTEFRYSFYKRWSVNAYMGMGPYLMPVMINPIASRRIGRAILASPKYKVNVGIDYAWGK